MVLMILDGLGINNDDFGNGVKQANMKNFNYYLENFSSTELNASGEYVGLPDGQMGNSEVGHLNIGAGRVVYQDFTRISKDIREDKLKNNDKLKDLFNYLKVNDKSLHLLGLVSDGGVHSHLNHLIGIVREAKNFGIQKVFIHAFTDGRDTPPRSANTYIRELQKELKIIGLGEIITVSGRYYAMDRDKRWERIEAAYNVMVHGGGKVANSPELAIENSYRDDIDDEFIIPTFISGKEYGLIKKEDGLLFFNFRADRARQITEALNNESFNAFDREEFLNLKYYTMTQYDKNYKNVEILYPPLELENTLGKFLSSKNKTQLRIAETEKYAHVTYFFNGGVEKEYDGETRVLVNSPKVATYDLKPEMSAKEVTDKLLEEISLNKHDLIVVNYANPDMVGHTGKMEPLIKALEFVDNQMDRVIKKVLELNGTVLLTSDHGNSEEMISKTSNKTITSHTTNKVPFIIIDKNKYELNSNLSISNIAPTILDIMGLEKPDEISENSIIKK